MKSLGESMAMVLVYGTGLAGSLTYSSNASRPAPAGGLECQLAARVQEERPGLRLPRRPGLRPPATVPAGPRTRCLGQVPLAPVPQVVLEERKFDLFAVDRAVFTSK